jgi:hypothetical protein
MLEKGHLCQKAYLLVEVLILRRDLKMRNFKARTLLWGLLAFVMVLIMLPATSVFASASISLDKTTYATGETIRITPSGIPHDMVGWIGLFRSGAPHTTGWLWENSVRTGSGVLEVTGNFRSGTDGVLADGSYEMRLFRSYPPSEANHIMTAPFVIDNSSVTISLDKTTYVAGETIRITPSGITHNMRGWIGLFRSGAPHTTGWLWENDGITIGTGVLEVTRGFRTGSGVLDDGSYEMRLYKSYPPNEVKHIMTVPFTKGGTVPTPAPTPVPTPTPTPAPTPPSSSGTPIDGFRGEAISAGAKLWWHPISGGMGYRVYRSENSNDEGVSITDFYITSNEFIDVNVRPNTTYHYTVRQVIREARPLEGHREELGPVTSRIQVTTPNSILGDNLVPPNQSAEKKFILMTMDDPRMSLNGIRQEIDPGRGTSPLILNSRTMVPIRAIVEGMNGTVGWDAGTRQISLDNGSHSVRMWVGLRELTANGVSKPVDVPPAIMNGRTMVPVRFSAENLGAEVDWLNSTRQVVIVYY